MRKLQAEDDHDQMPVQKLQTVATPTNHTIIYKHNQEEVYLSRARGCNCAIRARGEQ